MAEGFARTYGSDVMEVESAGLAPAAVIAPLTRQVMEEKNIRLDGQCPKSLADFAALDFDLILNMSGMALQGAGGAPVRMWRVRDPIGLDEAIYRSVRDEIEMLVMKLILELRRSEPAPPRS